jgi:hypothetical protein
MFGDLTIGAIAAAAVLFTGPAAGLTSAELADCPLASMQMVALAASAWRVLSGLRRCPADNLRTLLLLLMALQEVQALAAVGAHPNIVQYYSAWAEPDMQVGCLMAHGLCLFGGLVMAQAHPNQHSCVQIRCACALPLPAAHEQHVVVL